MNGFPPRFSPSARRFQIGCPGIFQRHFRAGQEFLPGAFLCGIPCRKAQCVHLVYSAKGVYITQMCVLLIDLRPDAAPLPGASLPPLSLSKERTLLLAEGLERMDFSVVTLCFARSALARECAARGLPVETLREGLSGLGLYLALRRIVSQYAARVIHLFGFEALGQAAWLRRSGTFWLVLTFEALLSTPARSHMKALRKVDAFLTPSALLTEELKKRASSGAVWLTPREREKGVKRPPLIRTVLPAVLPVKKSCAPRPGGLPFPLPVGHPALQGRADGNAPHFVFLVMGQTGEGAGLTTLFSAMARLRVLEEPSPWEVRVVGELPDTAALMAEAEGVRTAERLALIGAQDLDDIMAGCDAVISPLEDAGGQPEVLLLAWARSLPVIASSLPRHEELDPEKTAFLRFTPSTPVELADAMQKIIRSKELRKRLISNGEVVLKRLAPENFCAAHKAVYDELCGAPFRTV